LHPNTGEVLLPGGKLRLFDRFKALEVAPDFFAEMKDLAESLGLLFLCTPFGLQSARELHALHPEAIKIASPELNYTALLDEIASYKAPVLLSSGVSKLGDIEAALERLEGLPVCLLHCITAYPAPETEYNLQILPNLASIFGVPVGVSDHSIDPTLVPCLATVLGAAVLEKHFCLSRGDGGLDDPIALDPQDFARMTREVHSIAELSAERALQEIRGKQGSELMSSVLGDGVKRLAPSELANYERTKRSIHALRDIVPGEVLTRDMFAVLRTEKVLRPGLPPWFESELAGRTARRFIPAGQGLLWADV
jgi:sialic acid synthase SpsE